MPTALVTKQVRQDMIVEIIKSNEVHNQLDLIKFLEERGITATQSSVSRDIHELSIAKVEGRYVVAVLPVHGTSKSRDDEGDSRAFIKALTPAGPNVLVVKTASGGAPSVSLSVDKARWPEVLGTVASDDTVFMATSGKREQLRLITRLQEFMHPAAPLNIVPVQEIGSYPVEEPRPEALVP